MAALLPYYEVGVDPRDGQQFAILTLSGARQLAEVLTEAVKIMEDGLKEQPELDTDICKIETDCGKVHMVFVTDNTLDKIMGTAKRLLGMPKDYNPWTNKKGEPINTQIPDWLLALSDTNPDEDVEQLRKLLGPDEGSDAPSSPVSPDPED